MMYDNCTVYGPYINKEGRKHVIIIFPDGRRLTKQNCRYLIEIKLGHEIDKSLDVHHKDEDITNDALDNLELKEKKAHRGEHKKQNILDVEYVCPECGKRFSASASRQRDIRHNQGTYKKAGPFCSRSCAGKFSQRQ